MGYAFGFFVKVHHLTLYSDGVDFVETASIVTGVSEQRRGRHLGVEGRGFLEVFVPYFIDGSYN